MMPLTNQTFYETTNEFMELIQTNVFKLALGPKFINLAVFADPKRKLIAESILRQVPSDYMTPIEIVKKCKMRTVTKKPQTTVTEKEVAAAISQRSSSRPRANPVTEKSVRSRLMNLEVEDEAMNHCLRMSDEYEVRSVLALFATIVCLAVVGYFLGVLMGAELNTRLIMATGGLILGLLMDATLLIIMHTKLLGSKR
ncbi:hypothetical protein J8273_6716 [Carpediemonas membranifera]|uniref:Uncharacterized protein n=1 Tax=Carpediemonas membranifera TaxID=201153 RepID=A0A8J6E2J7_9EUKA|nr:hypothetical protein J8273_6716 [Carpediemonas membranifera]|eukprot:KAG9391987.1 hypothetical protein J8273_6716 [Carpediemonas membranifera]